MWPVPEGKGIRLALREKYLTAKWRGVEKCSMGIAFSQVSLEVNKPMTDWVYLERNLSELK